MSLRQESLYPWSGLRFVTSIVVSTAFVWSTYVVVGGVWGHQPPTQPPTEPPRTSTELPQPAIADPWAPTESPRTLPFQATASRHFRPDTMTFTITASGKGTSNTAAAHAAHATVRKVHDFLLAQGITEDEISYEVAQTDLNSASDDSGSAATPPEYDSTQDVTITVTDLARGQRAHNAAVIAETLGTAEVGAVSCSSHATDGIQEQLNAEAREKVAADARLAMKQYGGQLGPLQSADPAGSVEVGNDCIDIVATVTANATYVVK
jgi:uncharacterized protein YggE